MKTLLSLALAAAIGFAASVPAMAETDAAANAAMLQQVAQLQHDWAVANYQTKDADKQSSFKALVARASKLTAEYPGAAEPKVWEAIIRAGFAGSMGGLQSMFSAMPQMKQGRDLLLAAEKIDPGVMHGAVYTTLGSFYYMVPGGFIGFGDDDKALAYLNKGLAIAPDGMDANYFMGDYWLHEKKYAKAVPYFEKVLALPDVASRPIYSKGRKAEAAAKLAEARKHMH